MVLDGLEGIPADDLLEIGREEAGFLGRRIGAPPDGVGDLGRVVDAGQELLALNSSSVSFRSREEIGDLQARVVRMALGSFR
jgi:hypothetical protein